VLISAAVGTSFSHTPLQAFVCHGTLRDQLTAAIRAHRSLAVKLRNELLASDPPYVSRATVLQLAKWCKTDSPLETNTEHECRGSPEPHWGPAGCNRVSPRCGRRDHDDVLAVANQFRKLRLMRVQLPDSFGSVCLRQGTCHPRWHWPKLGLSGRNLPHGSEHFLLAITRNERSKNVVDGLKTGRLARG